MAVDEQGRAPVRIGILSAEHVHAPTYISLLASMPGAHLVGVWDEIRQLRDRLWREAGNSRVHAQALRRALLTAAFSGRLTGSSIDLDRAEEMVTA